MAYLIKDTNTDKYYKSDTRPLTSDKELITNKLGYAVGILQKAGYENSDIISIFKKDLEALYKKGFSINKLHNELGLSSYSLRVLFNDKGILRDRSEQSRISRTEDLGSPRSVVLLRESVPKNPESKIESNKSLVRKSASRVSHKVHKTVDKTINTAAVARNIRSFFSTLFSKSK